VLTSTDIAACWRDRRLKQVSGSTVEQEMTILSHACSVARREWDREVVRESHSISLVN